MKQVYLLYKGNDGDSGCPLEAHVWGDLADALNYLGKFYPHLTFESPYADKDRLLLAGLAMKFDGVNVSKRMEWVRLDKYEIH